MLNLKKLVESVWQGQISHIKYYQNVVSTSADKTQTQTDHAQYTLILPTLCNDFTKMSPSHSCTILSSVLLFSILRYVKHDVTNKIVTNMQVTPLFNTNSRTVDYNNEMQYNDLTEDPNQTNNIW
jgi:hypothetical protein